MNRLPIFIKSPKDLNKLPKEAAEKIRRSGLLKILGRTFKRKKKDGDLEKYYENEWSK